MRKQDQFQNINQKTEQKTNQETDQKTDQETLNKIYASARCIEIPEQLTPEAVKARLDAEKQKNAKTQKTKRSYYRNLAAAACLCICIGGASVSYFYSRQSQPQIKLQEKSDHLQNKELDSNKEPDLNEESAKKSELNGAAKSADEASQGQEKSDERKVTKLGSSYRLASDYGDVYDAVKKAQAYSFEKDQMREETTGVTEDASAGDAASNMKAEFDSLDNVKEAAKDFSTTNLQVEGVDESDKVKTDGKYVYAVQEERIRILDAQSKALKLVATLKPDLEESLDSICEIYVADNVLTVVLQADQTEIKNEEDKNGDSDAKEDAAFKEEQKQMYKDALCYDMLYLNYDLVTKALTYDISDPKHPVLLASMEQDGIYQSSRKIGNHLYLFTSKQMFLENGAERVDLTKGSRAAEWIPKVNKEAVKADCIYIPKEGNEGVVMACVDLANDCAVLDTKMLVSQGAQLYVTKDSAFFYHTEYSANTEKTRIARFALESDGTIRAKAAAAVKGCVTDTFALSQSDGYLRVLTSLTVREPWENRVYVIDIEDMKVAGSLTGIAPGEMIYAARFVGKTGYFVTYRNTDPLFTVDFSKPKKPRLIGELSVTGFSEYLHFWSDTKLLGIGYETNPQNGEMTGVKLSMFDISDPKKVTELAKTVLQGVDDSEAMYDYKSVLIDRKKNLIAFTTQTYQERCHDVYHVFSYKNGAFARRLERPIGSKGCGDYTRSLYIGEKLYLVGSRKALTFSLEEMIKELGKITY